MARGNRKWNEATLDKKIKEGHGQGEGINYMPWYTVHDINSYGRARQHKGMTVPRIYHFLSDLEFNYFLILDWSDFVVDIREKYPLLDVEETVRISETLNIKHPTDKKSNEPFVMTSDFFIVTKKNGKYETVVRTVTPSLKLEQKRTIEKFEIERYYWESRGVDWGIVTETDIPMEVVNNLIWFDGDKTLKRTQGFSETDILSLIQILKDHIKKRELSLLNLTEILDKQYKTDTGTFLHLFKYLVCKKELEIDILKSIEITKMFTSDIIVR